MKKSPKKEKKKKKIKKTKKKKKKKKKKMPLSSTAKFKPTVIVASSSFTNDK